ncbi:hypothetical protein [Flavobacterium flavipallidum]|uniref:Uncharacterized protein n=1 Tax=Flavobacterium flavipallidum TaxID=3139140 RepID=A0ABU9HN84_9FLAO
MKNVKIDSVYFVQVASGPKGSAPYINFKDSGKTVTLMFENNTLIQKKLLAQFLNKDVKTYNFVKREGSKSFFPQDTRYFIYDDRFICDSDGNCDFTKENKRKRLMFLSLGFVIFIVIHYHAIRSYNKKIS